MNKDLSPLLARLEKGGPASKKEIRLLLGLTDPQDLEALFDAAARIRERHFGSRIFLYGFLYFSTFCRNDCQFCQYRRSNRDQPRYRKTETQIMEAAARMADSGVHLIDLTMGEDPIWQGMAGIQRLTDLAGRVKQGTGLPVMVSPGVLPPSGISHMAARGIEWYACYQETHNRNLFARLRPGQDYDDRWAAKATARETGMLIEEGILTGVGETDEDIADSILAMADLNIDQARVMTFVPQPGTPMSAPRNRPRELTAMAVMRLVLQDCLIPASLDVDGLDGLLPRLKAGANLVTSIIPPENGLAGVANPDLDIKAARRSLEHVLPVLNRAGLSPASKSEYRDWIQRRRHHSFARLTN